MLIPYVPASSNHMSKFLTAVGSLGYVHSTHAQHSFLSTRFSSFGRTFAEWTRHSVSRPQLRIGCSWEKPDLIHESDLAVSKPRNGCFFGRCGGWLPRLFPKEAENGRTEVRSRASCRRRTKLMLLTQSGLNPRHTHVLRRQHMPADEFVFDNHLRHGR